MKPDNRTFKLRIARTVIAATKPDNYNQWIWHIRAEIAQSKLKGIATALVLLLTSSIFAQSPACHVMGLYDVPAPQTSETCYTVEQLLGVLGCFGMDVVPDGWCSEHDYDGNDKVDTRDILFVLGQFRPDCDQVLVFPVVFHVIHLGEEVGTGSNISNLQIESQLAAINAGFDPGEFAVGIDEEYYTGPDSRIRFEFADSVATGADHPGITRHYGPDLNDIYETAGMGYNGSWNNEQEIKTATTWGWENYINIWVVHRIQNTSSTIGYAYFARTDWRDGIVLRSDGCGSVLHGFTQECCDYTLNFSRDEGDLGIHEMGHYFGLYHPFHLTPDCSVGEVNCETAGDKVCDTGPTTEEDLSCFNPDCSDPNVVRNWMHYSSETCRNRFTEGQKARMRAYAYTAPFDLKRTALWGN